MGELVQRLESDEENPLVLPFADALHRLVLHRISQRGKEEKRKRGKEEKKKRRKKKEERKEKERGLRKVRESK
jgi:hypothetical protein